MGQGGLSKKAKKVQEDSTCKGIQGSTSKEEIKCVCLNARSIINKKDELNIMVYDIKPHIQSCPATTRLVITLIGCNAVGRASRFFRPLGFFFFFFFILYIFFDCKLLYLLQQGCFTVYVRCHDVLLPLYLLYIYSYLFYCFMSENSSLELMFMFIQPTLSFLYALLVSRVGKYD